MVFLVSGTEAGIRLYLDEIVSITWPALTSQSWTTKAQAAVTISAIAQKLGRILGLIPEFKTSFSGIFYFSNIFFLFSFLRFLSFPTLSRSAAWCFGQRIGWSNMDWKSECFICSFVCLPVFLSIYVSF